MLRRLTVAAAVTAAALTFPDTACSQQRPDLIVMIAVDQLRGDYIEKYAGQFSSGLALLRKESIFFPNGLQNHGLTETAPGHASMLSGRYPAHTGIFSNEHGVPDRLAPLVGVTAPANTTFGASPERFLGTELYDWMLASDSNARVLSIARKDRAAILMTGKARAHVYWWLAGRFTTSVYYRSTLPDWLNEFNAELKPGLWAGRVWDLSRPESDYSEVDDNPYEGAGRPRIFPHALPDSSRVMARLERWPWMDSLTAAAALRGVNAMQLGKRGTTDLLNVSFSALDAIGHDFGPGSREVHDHLLRLDKYIGFLLDSLWKIVPRERTIIGFTADHGVNPFPESLAQKGQDGGKISMGDVTRALTQRYARYQVNFDFSVNNSTILADVAALRARGISVDSVAQWAAQQVAQKPGVARVFTPATLASAPASDSAAMLWKRQMPAGFGWLTLGVAKPGYQFNTGSQADHGTMSQASRSVPIAFVVPGLTPRTVSRAIETVDIGPTLAALIGIKPTEQVDGKVAAEVRR
jgi:hypothetical protein